MIGMEIVVPLLNSGLFEYNAKKVQAQSYYYFAICPPQPVFHTIRPDNKG